jgi:hypothetical protein
MRRPTPGPLGHDDDVLTQSEALDEDELGVDPLEGGMDPAEDWSAANRYGTTAIEQATERPLDERLGEECPDVSIRPVPDRPLLLAPLEELDESIDDEQVAWEPVSEQGQVVVDDEMNNTGESATRRNGYLVTEPDIPAAEETSYAREE